MAKHFFAAISGPARWASCILAALLLAAAVGADSITSPTPGVDAKKVAAHWAFKPVADCQPPDVNDSAWCRNAIDHFILHALEQKGLHPSPEADCNTLVRRLYLDLTGLPPTPKQIDAFINDTSPDAYERLVDALLASPAYGQQWGAYWLEVAGYADSNGYFEADTDRPYAFEYRDYVVRSFNHDKPYDQFIREQVAGDELAGYVRGDDIVPENFELLTATHFFRNAPDGTGESDGNPQELAADRYAVLEGNLQILGSAFLGLTVQCARCHDHKFEPITQLEYYQLQAILKPAYDHDHWLKPAQRLMAVGPRKEVEKTRSHIAQIDKEVAALKESIDGLKQPLARLIRSERLANVPNRAAIEKAADTNPKDRTEAMKALLKKNAKLVEVDDGEITQRFPEVSPELKQLNEVIAQRDSQKPSLRQLSILSEPTTRPAAHHLLTRGRYTDIGREAPPGVPAVLSTPDNPYTIPDTLRTSGRRLALANWLTSPYHPTVTRLAVNRIWQHHFGASIVTTPENFGLTGTPPTHPQLLDFLANELIRNGWHIKPIQRLIVCSATYRQSGKLRDDAMSIDPEDRLLWRFPQQRLSAEAVRDSMLAISGELDPTAGGPYVPVTADKQGQLLTPDDRAGALRRSLYLQHRRTKPSTLLEVFDSPEMAPNCTRRIPSTVTLQSLALLNSDFVRHRSRALAKRLLAELDETRRLNLTFESVLARPPTVSERSAAIEFLTTQAKQYNPNSPENVWTDFCQMLFASNAFLYVD
jgi:hypothetical protein